MSWLPGTPCCVHTPHTDSATTVFTLFHERDTHLTRCKYTVIPSPLTHCYISKNLYGKFA